ncbi:MAG: ArnT family glycosyltransferase [Anaerolineae bacterium]
MLLLIGTWLLRWIALMDVPPGWRDDDLIELYTFSLRVIEEGPRLYFDAAAGQAPLFHTLRAPVVALVGVNQASARWMSAMACLLSMALMWAVGRRIFGRAAGLLGAALMSGSFWSLMYSRVAIRHIGTLPWILLAVYWGWRQLHDTPRVRGRDVSSVATGPILGMALGVSGAMLTYYAGRLVPVFLAAAYPLARPRQRRWKGYAAGLLLGLLLTVPTFWAAAQMMGADARVKELAGPIHALSDGNPGPLLRNSWITLGMFHANGDPEWLYNLAERPVFGPLGAALFYASLIAALVRWRDPDARWLLLWLVAGISPALISFPPSSYGHTIMALPAVYLLLAGLAWSLGRRWRYAGITVALLIAATVGIRDLPDYFGAWPAHSMVRFLYRADYRNLAAYIDAHPEIENASVGSVLSGSWDKVALNTDLQRPEAGVRWVNPARTMVFTGGEATCLYLQDEGERHPKIQGWLEDAKRIEAPDGMQAYLVSPPSTSDDGFGQGANRHDVNGVSLAKQSLGGAMTLETVAWQPSEDQGGVATLTTQWRVTGELPLVEEILIANQPPPGVYNGPRLKVFAHLVRGEEVIGIDDGLWLDPWSLVPGDLIVQFHRFDLADSPAGPFTLRIGLYDPLTGLRWTAPDGSDMLVIEIEP